MEAESIECYKCNDTGLVRKRSTSSYVGDVPIDWEVETTWCLRCNRGSEWKQLLSE